MAPPTPTGGAPVGQRIRARRAEVRLTQARLAERVGISASYLNLIEHNRRPIGGALLLRIAAALNIGAEALAGREEGRLADQLAEIATDPALAGAIPPERLPELVGTAPELARAALSAYRAYRDARAQTEALAERLAQDPFLAEASHQLLTLITSIRSFSEILEDYGDLDEAQRQRFVQGISEESRRLGELSGEMFDFLGGRAARRPQQTPEEEVDDLFHDAANHFPAIESAAEAARARIEAGSLRGGALFAALVGALGQEGVRVRFVAPEDLGGPDHRFDPEARELLLSDLLPNASWRFQAARLLGRLTAGEVIEEAVQDPRLSSDAARARARAALASAYAGAFLFPHDAFLTAAVAARWDIERLMHGFSASFEQVCHRFASLRRAGEGGDAAAIPFHFLRTDVAGNISKRFSASGLRLPRYTGACPRWVCHTAFLTPGRIVAQLARLPEGATYLFVAQAFSRPGAGWDSPRTHHSVMIGCDVAFARHMVYGDALNLDRSEPVGVSCRQCARRDCGQRALPALDEAVVTE